MEVVKIKDIKPADYNPRALSAERFEELKKSIQALGVIKPILVRAENKIIIAGHQRTKAMLACGIKECPAYFIKGITLEDECRFNQLHNSCEIEMYEKAPILEIECPLAEGWNVVPHNMIRIKDKGACGMFVGMLDKLYRKYGTFGSGVASKDGKIIVSAAYVYMAKLNRANVDVFVVPNDKRSEVEYYFSKNYGEFNYEHIKRETYIQTLAQMNRLRDGAKGKGNSMKSTLYEKRVIPYLRSQNKKLRILDFGAGKYDYAKRLEQDGYDILYVDPYHRVDGKDIIDVMGNSKRFLQICESIERKGLFDVVVCDSVLNSVDTQQAHDDVVLSVYGLCRMGGKVFISGRPKEDREKRAKKEKTSRPMASHMCFLDENNFTALYRRGHWFFQRMHDKKQREALGRIFGEKSSIYLINTAFHVCATKSAKIDDSKVLNALKREFNMMLPSNTSYGLGKRIEDAYKKAKKLF